MQSYSSPLPPSSGLEQISISDLWNTIWRRKFLILAVALSFFMLAVAYAKVTPKFYRAESVILLESQSKNLEIKSVLAEMPNDQSLIPSEIQVLISRNLMSKVIDELDMVYHPEVIDFEKGQEIKNPEQPVELSDAQKANIRESLVSKALGQLSVKQIDRSRAISISYLGKDPVLAAKIVNKLTEIYIEQQISSNFEAVRITNSWLAERVEELQKKVKESEQKVADYRAKRGLINSRGSDLVDQDVAELSRKLTDAKARLADAQSRLTEISDPATLDSAPSVLSSLLIQRLRESEATARNDLASLSDKLGPGHPQITAAKAKVGEIQNKIQQEIGKIADGMRREYRTSLDNVRLIEKQIAIIKKDYNSDKQNNVDLDALQREAETNRKFLETINLRWKETQSQEDNRLQVPYARVLSMADVPEKPESPKTKLIIIAALFAGLGLGGVVALVLDQMQNNVYNGKQIQALTGLTNISLIADVSNGKNEKSMNYADLPLSDASSPYMDGVRDLSAFLKMERSKDPSLRVFCLTSARKQEGKTSLTASLARQLALEGMSVVVIDCDVRDSTLSMMFDMSDRQGLTEILRGDISVQEAIVRDSETTLSIIPIGEGKGDINVMIQSPDTWAKIISKLQENFEIILMDGPSVLSTPESKIISRMAHNIFCIRWKKTPLQVIDFALDSLKRSESHVMGTVVTMAGGPFAQKSARTDKVA